MAWYLLDYLYQSLACMQRRDFLTWTGAGMVFSPAVFPLTPEPLLKIPSETVSDDFFRKQLIRENDMAIERLRAVQCEATDPRRAGGIPNAYGIETAMGTAMFVQYLASGFGEKSSAFFESKELLDGLLRATQFLLTIQHKDGTIDLHSTNFHSTPDTAFVVEPLAIAYRLLKDQPQKNLQEPLANLKRFLLDAGRALKVGGIHTPNHRWVVCMALARIHALFPDQAYVDRMDQWLQENIDIDSDGQYTEKSTHVYSPLTNRCLITISRLMDRPDLLEPVRRNLEMTLYYLHPNSEIATEASGRQDQYRIGSLQTYFYSYRYMALKEKNGQFASIAREIPRRLPIRQLVRNLAYFQEDSFLLTELPPTSPLPTNYEKIFADSALVRIRREQRDATILAYNPTFFTFQQGEAVLQGVRLASAFFGKGQFEGEKLLREGDSYVLEQYLTGPYYQPYPADRLPGDGDWEKMPRSQRPQSEIQRYKVIVRINETSQGFQLSFEISGTDYVPVAIEMGFRHGGSLSGVRTLKGMNDAYLLEGKEAIYRFGQQEIIIGPGQSPHSWTQLRGALPKLDAMSVYITGFTPFQWTMEVKGGK